MAASLPLMQVVARYPTGMIRFRGPVSKESGYCSTQGQPQRLIRALSIVLFLSGAVSFAGDVTDSSVRLVAVLFPSTAGWIPFEKAPRLSETAFSEERERLRASYLSFHMERPRGDFDCSTIDRVLQGSSIRYFHIFDGDADGHEDIVYSGPAQCAEGDVTIIWFGNGDESVESMHLVEWNVRILSVAPRREPGVTSVAIGCCADPIDEYSFGTLDHVHRYGVVRTTKDTRAPSGVLTSPVPFTNRGETVLRSTPERKAEYDPDLSGLMDSAVFGNILCSYIAGASGEIRAEERDARGKVWAYVVMNPESNRLRHDAPFDVNVGWVERSLIHEAKSRSHAPSDY